MKLYVLVKSYELVVESVELFRNRPDAEAAFKKWTAGISPAQLARREASNIEERFSQTKIFEVDLVPRSEKLQGKWQCDSCLEEFDTLEDLEAHMAETI